MNNMSFFHPTLAEPQQGIKLHDLLRPETSRVQAGVLLGSSKSKPQKKGKPVATVREGSKVVWCMPESMPRIEKGVALEGSVLTIPTDAGGFRHFVYRHVGDGKYLVQVQTGLLGSSHEHVRQIIEQARAGSLPLAHGSFALDDGSKRIDGAARHIRWWVPKTKLDGTNVPARRMDFWELSEGAPLLVADIFAGSEARLVVEKGVLRKVDAGKKPRQLFDELEAKRQAARAAERA